MTSTGPSLTGRAPNSTALANIAATSSEWKQRWTFLGVRRTVADLVLEDLHVAATRKREHGRLDVDPRVSGDPPQVRAVEPSAPERFDTEQRRPEPHRDLYVVHGHANMVNPEDRDAISLSNRFRHDSISIRSRASPPPPSPAREVGRVPVGSIRTGTFGRIGDRRCGWGGRRRSPAVPC